ncbi:MAG: TRAP transporter small permease [Xanthomonadales bacterium]|nr:TRAP transporter small permease [Gammaproteobacteria bacterium]MBT8051083.1 TRAP transporter small permease [Gammaproteobacteria bacterium]MBT8055870.1 TRAP transporter small permease [Gammaproteobacteria bacterium]NNJ79142.1 TRAP transporter small permease [Xanthomonadales bacterium]NNK38584.1 TRAP transporter small permease [Xanthomonadales bacterium]
MERMIRILDAFLSRFLILLMLLLVVAVLWQVTSRYLFSSPSSWTEEIARFLLIWISLSGAVYAFRTGMHLGLDILPKKLEGRAAAALKGFTITLIVLFSFTVLVYGGTSLVMMTWELKQYSAVLGLPMAWVYSVIPASGILICIYALAAIGVESIGKPRDAVVPGE